MLIPDEWLANLLAERRGGLIDVTPLDFPPGTMPVGIDAEGRIAIISSDEDQFNIRSFVLIPKRTSD